MKFFDPVPKAFITSCIPEDDWFSLNESQVLVDGFDWQTHQDSKVLVVGAGALGSHVMQGLIRKGTGVLSVSDHDEVELKNNTRQLFTKEDVGQNKAVALAKSAAAHGHFDSTVTAYPCRFQEALAQGWTFDDYNIFICLPDNNPTRVAVSKHGLKHGIPVIHAAVGRDGNIAQCVVQEIGYACFGCIFPQHLNDTRYPCHLPGIIDVIQVAAGLVVYAVDTVLCGRPRDWNYKRIYLAGGIPDRSATIERNPECPLCGPPSKDAG